jgi:MFS transporter, DHA2 family, multidrug resistance protein
MNTTGNTKSSTGLDDWLIFMSVVMAASVYAAAWTIPNAVLPQMRGDLSVSIDEISWVVTATVVAGAIGIPLTPWLANRFGAKKLMLSTLGAFSLGSVMVGTATTFEEVIIWRVVAALSGSPIIALSQAVTLETFKSDKRTMAFSIWSIGMVSGWVFAPTVGAWLADLVSWRLTFLSIVPFGLVAMMCCYIFMPDAKKTTRVKFDWFGYINLATALTMIQLVVNRGQRMDWFESPGILLASGIGCIAFYLYIIHTLHCKNPFLNWEIFSDRNFVLGLLMTMIYAYVGLVPLVVLPTMLEQLRGLEVTTIGLLLVPRGIAQMLGMIAVGILASRMDPRILLIGGLIVFSGSSAYMAHYTLTIGITDIILPTIFQGFSMAFIWIPIMALMYATIDDKLRTSAASMVSLTYSLSSSLGVALAITVLQRSLQTNHEEIGGFIDPTRKVFLFDEISSMWNIFDTTKLLAIENEITLQAYSISYANVFWLLTLSTTVIIPLVFLLRRPSEN